MGSSSYLSSPPMRGCSETTVDTYANYVVLPADAEVIRSSVRPWAWWAGPPR
jgi:hypothetical protein